MGLCEAPPNKLPLKKQVPSVKEAGEVAPPNPPMPFCSAGELLCFATNGPWTRAAASFHDGALCSTAAVAPAWAFRICAAGSFHADVDEVPFRQDA